MLIVTAKMPRRKLALGVAAAALLCCCAVALNIGQGLAREASASSLPDPKGVRSNQDRVDYLAAYGWQVSQTPIATQEFIIPQEMDSSYDEYLSLQREQGFHLEELTGKRVKRYTYEVLNYPSGEAGVQANLLIYRGRVVGGEVLSPQLDGFLHGLRMP